MIFQITFFDFDNDGDVDLVTAGKIFLNQGNDNKWLKIKLIGDGEFVNSDAIGAQVRIKLKGQVFTRQVEAGTGEGNQNELTLHFGLGQYNDTVDLEIFWTKDMIQELHEIKLNQLIKIKYDKKKCSNH